MVNIRFFSTFASLKVFCVSGRGKFVISWGLILSNDSFRVHLDRFQVVINDFYSVLFGRKKQIAYF